MINKNTERNSEVWHCSYIDVPQSCTFLEYFVKQNMLDANCEKDEVVVLDFNSPKIRQASDLFPTKAQAYRESARRLQDHVANHMRLAAERMEIADESQDEFC